MQTQKSILKAAGSFLFWSLAFGLSYTQSPLYTSNQNQYFLHGLADAGYGLLQEDWLANTADPTPAFSFLVYLTVRLGHENLFYLYHFLLLGVYFHALAGIARTVFPLHRSRAQYLFFLGGVILIHSALLDHLAANFLGIRQTMLLSRGVASQYLPGYELQPGVFGVFLLLSIYLFLRRKPYWAVFCLALAATFHPSSLPGAAILTLSYMILAWREEKNLRKTLAIGLPALALVLPVLIYTGVYFQASDPETWRGAQQILAEFRIPHHILSKKSEMGELFYLRVLLMLLALYAVRKHRLFAVLAIPFSIAAVLTVIQILSDSNALGLLFPWRLSTVLVPLSVCLLFAGAVAAIFPRLPAKILNKSRWIAGVSGGVILLLALWGAREMKSRFEAYANDPARPMMNFVKKTKSRGEKYLIPALHLEELENFRLCTGAPILADFKSIPYKDTEVLDWYDRNLKARQFYETVTLDCELLKALAAEYGITHLVTENRRFSGACEEIQPVYRDEVYSVYKIR